MARKSNVKRRDPSGRMTDKDIKVAKRISKSPPRTRAAKGSGYGTNKTKKSEGRSKYSGKKK
jgi:hypothetical protein